MRSVGGGTRNEMRSVGRGRRNEMGVLVEGRGMRWECWWRDEE